MQSLLVSDSPVWCFTQHQKLLPPSIKSSSGGHIFNGLKLITPNIFHKTSQPQACSDHRKLVRDVLKAGAHWLEETCSKSFKSGDLINTSLSIIKLGWMGGHCNMKCSGWSCWHWVPALLLKLCSVHSSHHRVTSWHFAHDSLTMYSIIKPCAKCHDMRNALSKITIKAESHCTQLLPEHYNWISTLSHEVCKLRGPY